MPNASTVFIIIIFCCTSFDQVLEHFLKHGKTKEEEEEEVKFQEALAQKRLEQVYDEKNLQIFDLCVIVKGRDVTEEEEIELLKG